MKNTSKHVLLPNVARTTSILLLLTLLFTPETAFSDSGIRIANGIELISEPPSAHETSEVVLKFAVKIENLVCNERVTFSVEALISIFGSATVLGFRRNTGDPYDPSLSFELEDETTQPIFFGVETGEDMNGCDFRAFSVFIKVCDTGPNEDILDCDYGFIPLCEPPTPHFLAFSVEAERPEVTGNGRIFGIVTQGPNNRKVNAEIKLRKVSGCIPNQPDDANAYFQSHNTFTDASLRGTFDVGSLPFGTYEVTAVWDGHVMTQNATLNQANPEQSLFFPFP